jgi:hypothetical protein
MNAEFFNKRREEIISRNQVALSFLVKYNISGMLGNYFVDCSSCVYENMNPKLSGKTGGTVVSENKCEKFDTQIIRPLREVGCGQGSPDTEAERFIDEVPF